MNEWTLISDVKKGKVGRPQRTKSVTERWRTHKKRQIEEGGSVEFIENNRKRQQKYSMKSREKLQENPIAFCSSREELDEIEKIVLQYALLRDARPCPHCGAYLFHEELSRKKWCCAQGELFFPKPAPLAEGFYKEASFLKDIREYNNLFAFSALGVTGGFQGPPGGYGTSMVKIQGKVYHRIFDLSWQNSNTSNNSEL